MMKFVATELDGVTEVFFDPRRDDRGMFMRRFCAEEHAGAGLNTRIEQINHSYSKVKGTIRGLHYQLAPAMEDKFVHCLHGRIFDVAVDIRKGSPTFLHWVGRELGEGNALYVPRGFAHGFQALEDDVITLYMNTVAYAAPLERGFRFNDPAFAIEWPLPHVMVSDRDLKHKLVDNKFEGVHVS